MKDMTWKWIRGIGLVTGAALTVAACDAPVEEQPTDETPALPGLSDLDILLEGSPDPNKLPDEPKSDATYPRAFDLVDLQSPVRDQASRGVCSMFSTVALMEHLYIKEGKLLEADFSEHFLQWSSKVEHRSYRTTEGSNADANLSTINRYGIVEESVAPYETRPWNRTHDARCTGEKDQPVICYTNGDPTPEQLEAERFHLPPGRWVSPRTNSIKAFMWQNQQAVIAGFSFFYQSWNHGGSALPLNNSYKNEGYVTYPNAEDITDSKAKPAGHSILLVGWDDDLEVPMRDGQGKTILDDEGNPKVEKGFFLFKNSWGTSAFGTRNPFGAGYGWISMRYIEEYGTINASDVPDVNFGPEVCDDGIDNNRNRLVDCEDVESCGDDPVCNTADHVYNSRNRITIPDNDAQGNTSSLIVDRSGQTTDLWVEVDITHPFVRDLEIVLTLPDGESLSLYKRDDVAGRNMNRRFLLPSMIGREIQGTWSLTVIDHAERDTGYLNSWSLGLATSEEVLVEICDDGIDNTGNGLVDCDDPSCALDDACESFGPETYLDLGDGFPIPDGDPNGASESLQIGPGIVTHVAVDLEITHPYRGDLEIRLIAPDGHSLTLLDRSGGNQANVNQAFETSYFNGRQASGDWSLQVIDHYHGDTGTVEAWLLEVEVR